MKQTAKIIARGLHDGEPTVIEVIEYNGGFNKHGDRKHGNLIFFKDGVNFKQLRYEEDREMSDEEWKSFDYLHDLRACVRERHLKLMKATHVYNPLPNTIEAYWLAFNHGDGFDEVPEIEVEGKIDTLGSPFSDEDTSHIYF